MCKYSCEHCPVSTIIEICASDDTLKQKTKSDVALLQSKAYSLQLFDSLKKTMGDLSDVAIVYIVDGTMVGHTCQHNETFDVELF